MTTSTSPAPGQPNVYLSNSTTVAPETASTALATVARVFGAVPSSVNFSSAEFRHQYLGIFHTNLAEEGPSAADPLAAAQATYQQLSKQTAESIAASHQVRSACLPACLSACLPHAYTSDTCLQLDLVPAHGVYNSCCWFVLTGSLGSFEQGSHLHWRTAKYVRFRLWATDTFDWYQFGGTGTFESRLPTLKVVMVFCALFCMGR